MIAEEKAINDLVEKAVGSHIRTEMKMVSKAFNNIINNYSFLFDGDILLTQKMLIAACFPTDISLVEKANLNEDETDVTEGKVYFNMKEIIKHIPDDMKEELYRRVMEQFVTKLSIEDINERKG